MIISSHAPLKISKLPLDTSKKQITGHSEPSQWIGEKTDRKKLEVAKLLDELNALESTPAIIQETIEALARVRKSIKATCENFKNFKWKL
ncbi:hypothetical protein E5676_scaffold95G001070 [Cucumis melo var. makuwa]|uniref:Uncharacterized protein n=1 Tax=Cucumis melo var. makuwa TaxID=1194695 RepID=A0A5A7TIH8_CUCMM|nr:hypothetical protein E6C27_scaffold67G001790 [Cucumis melo var. makuwa]TYK27095.1 hypothetical protein E5676_scaffold95G001070 [Cucumis melo var. makuwa]